MWGASRRQGPRFKQGHCISSTPICAAHNDSIRTQVHYDDKERADVSGSLSTTRPFLIETQISMCFVFLFARRRARAGVPQRPRSLHQICWGVSLWNAGVSLHSNFSLDCSWLLGHFTGSQRKPSNAPGSWLLLSVVCRMWTVMNAQQFRELLFTGSNKDFMCYSGILYMSIIFYNNIWIPSTVEISQHSQHVVPHLFFFQQLSSQTLVLWEQPKVNSSRRKSSGKLWDINALALFYGFHFISQLKVFDLR